MHEDKYITNPCFTGVISVAIYSHKTEQVRLTIQFRCALLSKCIKLIMLTLVARYPGECHVDRFSVTQIRLFRQPIVISFNLYRLIITIVYMNIYI